MEADAGRDPQPNMRRSYGNPVEVGEVRIVGRKVSRIPQKQNKTKKPQNQLTRAHRGS